MGRGALDRMADASSIPYDTLVAYKKGRRTPPPDKIEAFYRAAVDAKLGAEVKLGHIGSDHGGVRVDVDVTSIPELDQQQWWKGRDGWLNCPQPHLAYDDRFHVRPLADVEEWFHLGRLVADGPDAVSIAVFPRAEWTRAGSSWLYAILDLARYHREISGEFMVAHLREERKIRTSGGKLVKITPDDLMLCQQMRYAPRSGPKRQFRIVPAWPWPTNNDESAYCLDFQPFEVALALLKPLYHGNLRHVPSLQVS